MLGFWLLLTLSPCRRDSRVCSFPVPLELAITLRHRASIAGVLCFEPCCSAACIFIIALRYLQAFVALAQRFTQQQCFTQYVQALCRSELSHSTSHPGCVSVDGFALWIGIHRPSSSLCWELKTSARQELQGAWICVWGCCVLEGFLPARDTDTAAHSTPCLIKAPISSNILPWR